MHLERVDGSRRDESLRPRSGFAVQSALLTRLPASTPERSCPSAPTSTRSRTDPDLARTDMDLARTHKYQRRTLQQLPLHHVARHASGSMLPLPPWVAPSPRHENGERAKQGDQECNGECSLSMKS